MTRVYPAYRVAAVQASPVFLNREATTDKVCALIKEAADNGAKLVGFPESFIPGYPNYMYVGTPEYSERFFERSYRNAVEIPGETVRRISETCRENRIYCSISVNELSGATLYLSQLWFNSKGDLIGNHRKVRPTSGERYVWGYGDGSTMSVLETELGNLGGLQCWEHLMPMNLAAMCSMNEQVHVAAWPTFAPGDDHLFTISSNLNISRFYAEANACYVLMCSSPYTQEMHDVLVTEAWHQDPCPIGPDAAFTCIIDPDGQIVSKVDDGVEEGICYADIDLFKVIKGKYQLDPAGHSASPGSLSLNFNAGPQPAVRTAGRSAQTPIPFEMMQEN